jgi:hypothetical protein
LNWKFSLLFGIGSRNKKIQIYFLILKEVDSQNQNLLFSFFFNLNLNFGGKESDPELDS